MSPTERSQTEGELLSNDGEAPRSIPLLALQALTPTLLASARSNIKRARSELVRSFPTGLFAPAKDQSLLSWLDDGRRYSKGDRLVSNKVLSTVDGKKQLTDRTAHILRSIQYEFDIPMRRMPGLWNAFAVLFLDRPLQSNEFSSVPTLRVWNHRLHLIDSYLHGLDFKLSTTNADSYGNPVLFYTSDDDSKHFRHKRHIVLITDFKDDNGRRLPAWHQLTAGVAVSSSSEGNSDLNDALERGVDPHSSSSSSSEEYHTSFPC